MTIPTTGPFTSGDCQTEWSLSLPMTSAELAASASLSNNYSSEDLRGKSSVTIVISGSLVRVSAGAGRFREEGTFTVVVIGGGTPTAWDWYVEDQLSLISTPSTASTASFFVRGPTYWDNQAQNTETITISCRATVNGSVATATKQDYYTYNNIF